MCLMVLFCGWWLTTGFLSDLRYHPYSKAKFLVIKTWSYFCLNLCPLEKKPIWHSLVRHLVPVLQLNSHHKLWTHHTKHEESFIVRRTLCSGKFMLLFASVCLTKWIKGRACLSSRCFLFETTQQILIKFGIGKAALKMSGKFHFGLCTLFHMKIKSKLCISCVKCSSHRKVVYKIK
jgi:hypothetical protein